MAHTYINESHRAYSESCLKIIEETAKHPTTGEEMLARCIRNLNSALKEHKYIFMEYDGVVTSEQYTASLEAQGLPTMDRHCPVFDPDCIANLESIFKAIPEAAIILLSRKPKSRYYGIYKSAWDRQNRTGNIFSYVEVANRGPKGKGKTIKSFMHDHSVEEQEYVILCPQNEFLADQRPHVILTSPQCGLTREDAQRAIDILKTHNS